MNVHKDWGLSVDQVEFLKLAPEYAKAWTIKTASNMTQEMFALQRCQQQAAFARQSALYLPHATWYTSDRSSFPTRTSSRHLLNSRHQVLRSSTHRFCARQTFPPPSRLHTWTPIALEVPTLPTRTVLTPWFSYTSDISPLLSAHRQLTPIVP